MCYTCSKHFLATGVAVEGPTQSCLRLKDVQYKSISNTLERLWWCLARTYQNSTSGSLQFDLSYEILDSEPV